MDQAMGDLQTQLEEVKRMWEEERMARQRAENELEGLRRAGGQNAQQNQNQNQNQGANGKAGEKRDGDVAEGSDVDRDGKRQRTE